MVRLMAIEQIATGEMSSGRIYTTSTDENGQFRFEGVTPGEYRLMAMRPEMFVAARDFSASPFVEVAAGQTVAGVAITMEKPVTVSGTVRDQYGDPIAASVSLFARSGGVNSGYTTTSDSHGRYSVMGLRPGEYLLSAETMPIGRDVRMFDDSGEERSVAFRPSYYGGITDASLATTITIEERDLPGMDLVIRPVPASTVDVVVDPAGRPVGNVQVQMVPLDANAAAGRQSRTPVPSDSMHVVLPGMAAGQYWLIASGDERDADGSPRQHPLGAAGNQNGWFPPQTVRLQLEPPARVSGLVVFEGVSKPPQSVMVSLRTLPPGDLQTAFSNQASNSGRGLTFSIEGVMPGRLVLDAVDQATPRSPWILKSVRAGGRDVFDLPIDLAPGATMNDVVITFTDRSGMTEVSGTVTDSAGRPVTDAAVIVFSTDNRYWRNTTRHIKATLPDAKGHFTLAGLPPGEYAAASVFMVPTDDAATFLRTLLPTAVRFSLADGEHKVVDVRRVR
jgi:protocatechuate 3,4-dioxygenase beta subunit